MLDPMSARQPSMLLLPLLLSTASTLAADAGAAESEPFHSPRTEVQLVAERLPVQPDRPFRVGLRFRMQPGWHVYWKNPGDSGTPPSVEWTVPAGWSAGEIEWPTPRRIFAGPFVSFGYEGEIVLPVPVEPAAP